MNTISWKTPTTPLPMETNPRTVFERLFGGSAAAAERRARLATQRSILDSIAEDANDLQRTLGGRDRARVSDYLDNVREIERRIQRAESQKAVSETALEAPVGVPESFEEHVGLMFDLIAAAYQANVTRVFTFMLSRELSQRTYPQVGVNEQHHTRLASPEQRRQDGPGGEDQHVSHGIVREVPGNAADDRRRPRIAARSVAYFLRSGHGRFEWPCDRPSARGRRERESQRDTGTSSFPSGLRSAICGAPWRRSTTLPSNTTATARGSSMGCFRGKKKGTDSSVHPHAGRRSQKPTGGDRVVCPLFHLVACAVLLTACSLARRCGRS